MKEPGKFFFWFLVHVELHEVIELAETNSKRPLKKIYKKINFF